MFGLDPSGQSALSFPDSQNGGVLKARVLFPFYKDGEAEVQELWTNPCKLGMQ